MTLSFEEHDARTADDADSSLPSSDKSNRISNSTSDALQSRSYLEVEDATRDESSPNKDREKPRRTGMNRSKGLGQFSSTLAKSPMEVSIGLTRGCHNLAKLWGDKTVRPQPRINGFKSGAIAAGKGFGFAWYDGLTGLVTQPWEGAQSEGAKGFFKGMGKGMAGFLTKPTAAACGVLAYPMKGVHKEVQKLFGNNVQAYIAASRTPQGYEEWLQSSEAEREDVIARWKLIQDLRKKQKEKARNPEEIMRDALNEQRKKRIEKGDPPLPGPLGAPGKDETSRMSARDTSLVDAGEDASIDPVDDEGVQHSRQPAAVHRAEPHQATAVNDVEAQRHASETLQFERQLQQVLDQGPTRNSSDSDWEPAMGLNDEEDDEFERAERASEKMADQNLDGPPIVQGPPPYGPGHLAGTTQDRFEAQQQGGQSKKTSAEKTEEKIVMEYVRKQSLLEVHHKKGKGRASAPEDSDDEDLQMALKLSMQEVGERSGEASAACYRGS